MSEKKIKSKDLTYDSSLPPFLQRLHDRNAGRGKDQIRAARPKKARNDDEDDEPTVVDESGETLSKDEIANMRQSSSMAEHDMRVRCGRDVPTEPRVSEALQNDAPISSEDGRKTGLSKRITDGTAQKKRKVAKTVGSIDEPEYLKIGKDSPSEKASKARKKAKVRLVFDEEE